MEVEFTSHMTIVTDAPFTLGECVYGRVCLWETLFMIPSQLGCVTLESKDLVHLWLCYIRNTPILGTVRGSIAAWARRPLKSSTHPHGTLLSWRPKCVPRNNINKPTMQIGKLHMSECFMCRFMNIYYSISNSIATDPLSIKSLLKDNHSVRISCSEKISQDYGF